MQCLTIGVQPRQYRIGSIRGIGNAKKERRVESWSPEPSEATQYARMSARVVCNSRSVLLAV